MSDAVAKKISNLSSTVHALPAYFATAALAVIKIAGLSPVPLSWWAVFAPALVYVGAFLAVAAAMFLIAGVIAAYSGVKEVARWDSPKRK